MMEYEATTEYKPVILEEEIEKAFNYYDDDTYIKDIVNFFKNEKLEIKNGGRNFRIAARLSASCLKFCILHFAF